MNMRGHALALVTVLIWGVTFVSTKVLLEHLAPIDILFIRFVLGYAALWLLRPRVLRFEGWRAEAPFVAAGASGVAVYFLMENIALTFTTASDVGVIVAVSPLFTAIIASFVLRQGALRPLFALGFAVALAGVVLVSASGGSGLFSQGGTALVGCALALAAALVWAVYSNISKGIAECGFDTVVATRRIFFWGLVCMLPFLPLLGFGPDVAYLVQPVAWGNLVFLGLGASAACYVMWNTAVAQLGPVKTMAYIYLVPAVTVATSVVVLGEPLTWGIIAGVVLTIAGLFISERGSKNF